MQSEHGTTPKERIDEVHMCLGMYVCSSTTVRDVGDGGSRSFSVRSALRYEFGKPVACKRSSITDCRSRRSNASQLR